MKTTPYWWDRAPIRDLPSVPLPPRCDVAVVGGGLSGLFTALTLARGGRDVVVLEAEKPGLHASSRAHGAVGRTIRPKFLELQASHGTDFAVRVYTEAKAWLEHTCAFIEREGIDCELRRPGRLIACTTPEAYEKLARETEAQQKVLPTDTVMIPRAEQHREVGSDAYFGLQFQRDTGQLDMGRYHAGVLRVAMEAGVAVHAGTRVDAVEREREGFAVRTSRGSLQAREVVLCTNARTGDQHPLLRWFRRRVVPVSMYQFVTEPLDEETYRSFMPGERHLLETVTLYLAMLSLAWDRRILVGGRHLFRYDDMHEAAEAVRRQALASFPQLAGLKATHCWEGTFAMTFDWLPHMGSHEGVHYLLGLCGTGVPACCYLGHKLGLRILGDPEGETVFADRPFPTRPLYYGTPWFLPVARTYYRMRDEGARRKLRRAA